MSFVVVAAGELRRCTLAIPMGGSFSVQSADLHSMWCCKLRVDLLRRCGKFSKTDDGIVKWSARGTIFAAQQFRHNLVVASKGVGGRDVMQPVSFVLEEVWSLRVVSDCRAKSPPLLCTSACMPQPLTTPRVAGCVGSCAPKCPREAMELEDRYPVAKLLGHHAKASYEHFHRGPVQGAAVCCHMWRVRSIPCRLDAPCNIVPVPALCPAQFNDLPHRTGSSAHTVGCCKHSAEDIFCFRALVPGYVVFSFWLPQKIKVEDGFVCVTACTPHGALH